MINRLSENFGEPVEVQDTTLSTDILGRYVCNTWDEITNNGGIAFDAIVIGAGMFGAYCAEKLYRKSNLRVLVLDAGTFLVSEHVQNLARIGLNVPGAVTVDVSAKDPGPRERVWGVPWRSQVAFPGLAYCVGGRSLYWGGWAPRLTDADLARWPKAVADFLRKPGGGKCDADPLTPAVDAYCDTERETGTVPTTDYISGPLYDALRRRFEAVKSTVPTVDAIEDAPLAVQAAPPASGLFSFDKYSSAPILIDAIREAAADPDWKRRLFLVPRAHVAKLNIANGAVSQIEVYVNGKRRFIPVTPECSVVIAASTIESTRLALTSFPTPLIGRNLMAHLRSNLVVRIRRSAFGAGLPKQLEAAALLVRGSTASGRYHLQVTAAAAVGPNPENFMFRMMPDIDQVEIALAAQGSDWIVLILRGIGELQGVRDPSSPKQTGVSPSWVDLSPYETDEFGARRAWINLVAGPDDLALWDVMDTASVALAQKLAKNSADIEYFYDGSWHSPPPPAGKVRDGLGTTHHEAGALWMGTDPSTSVTNLDGRFHHIQNAYVAGPAIFPTIGSANPSLTGLTLARRTADAIIHRSFGSETDFRPVGSGGLQGWQMAGFGRFMELGGNIIESIGGPGILWYAPEEFVDFVLRVDWRSFNPDDNSGVFLRVPALGDSDPNNDWLPAVDRGYEVQIDDTGKNADTSPPSFGDPLRLTGAIYKLAPATKLATRPGDWNSFDIAIKRGDIEVRLNGDVVSMLENGSRQAKGHIGLQNHHEGSRVQFRNIRVKPL